MWRNTGRPVRVFVLDARACVPLLAFVVYWSWPTFYVAFAGTLFFGVISWLGLTVPAALRLHRDAVGFAPDEASYFLGNEVPVPSMRPELPPWQEQIFAFMTRNAVRAPDYFLIPPPRVVELGTRVEL